MATAREGILLKQGSITGGWNKKTVILQYNLLLVFDKPPSASTRGTPNQTINLSDCQIRPAEGLKKFGFQVIPPTGQKNAVAFAANSQEELISWMEALKEATKPAPVVKREEEKLPGRWDPPKNDDTKNNKGGGGGGGGGIKEAVPAPQAESAPAQSFQAPAPMQQSSVPSQQMPVSSTANTQPPQAQYGQFSQFAPAPMFYQPHPQQPQPYYPQQQMQMPPSSQQPSSGQHAPPPMGYMPQPYYGAPGYFPPQGYQMPPQGYQQMQMPPQGYQMAPQGYPQQGYQMAPPPSQGSQMPQQPPSQPQSNRPQGGMSFPSVPQDAPSASPSGTMYPGLN